MNHCFDIENAKKYGMLEAVLISNFEFWIAKNKANGVNCFDGKYWVYNSAKALNELFPYASEQQIKRALKHLREEGVLITGEFNKNAYDRTLWYTFSDDYLSSVKKETIDSSNLNNGEFKNDQPIPDIKTDINTNIDKERVSKDTLKKVKYAEFVTMTEEEHEKLTKEYGAEFTDKCIETLDNYKGSSGKKYKSDYRAILSWVVSRVQKDTQGAQKYAKPKPVTFADLLREEYGDDKEGNNADYEPPTDSISEVLSEYDIE